MLYEFLTDPRTPIAIRGLMFGSVAGAKIMFAVATWKSDFPSRCALLMSMWFGMAAGVHLLVVAGIDWRDVAALQWIQNGTMGVGVSAMIYIMRWKLRHIHNTNNLVLRVEDLEYKVHEMRSATGYDTANYDKPQGVTNGGAGSD